MQKYFNYFLDEQGNRITAASVLVKTNAGGAATIYGDNSGTTTTNPLTTDGTGYFEFYAPNGTYSLVLSKIGYNTVTLSAVLLDDPTVATIAALRAAGVPTTANARVSVLGYTTAGDGGGGDFYWVTGDQSANVTADPQSGIWVAPDSAPTGASGAWKRVYSGVVNLKWFGAVGDGASAAADTAAISAAWAYITSPDVDRYAALTNEPSYFAINGPKLRIPAGDYIYTGSALSLGVSQSWIFHIEGDGCESTRIQLPSIYFIDTDSITGFKLHGIHFYGGKGVVRQTADSTNVGRFAWIEKCVFSEYTECAIASASRDNPYFKIKDNQFRGAQSTNTMAIALAGYSAGSTIIGNAFQRFKYGIKFAPAVITGNDQGPCVPINIYDNDFYRDTNGPTNSYDVWIVPNQDTTDNAGRGMVFAFNKFGNENLNSGDCRILVALEAAGTYISDKQHTTTNGGYVSGVAFFKNNVNCNGNGNIVPFIKSYTARIANFDVDDIYDNGIPTYICEYDSGVTTDAQTSQSVLNRVSLRQALSIAEGELAPVLTNMGGAWLADDPWGYSADDDVPMHWTGGDGQGSYINLLTPTATSSFTAASATSFALDNSIGEIDEAAEVTMTASDGRFVGAITFASAVEGRQAWLEGEIMEGSATSLDYVRVEITDDAGKSMLRRTYRLTSAWRRFRIPWTPRKTGVTALNVKISSPDYSAGVRTIFKVGRFAVYHSHEPINTGHLKALNSSYSRQHLLLGSYHAWVDADNKVLQKSSAPTSATDGTSVGLGSTQSTVGAAGGASALPATPTGYVKVRISGTEYVIPYYAQA